jgi:RND family efflux transporter MFP subunit
MNFNEMEPTIMRINNLAALLLALSLPLYAQEAAQEPPPALVELQDVRSEMIADQIWVPGTVVSRSDSDIASEVAGRITWMADVGDLVESGDVLATLDDHMFKLEYEQNQSNIVKWQAKVEQLQRKQKRFATMLGLNNTSRDQQDEIISELEIARQELAQAKIDKRQTEYKLSQTQVKAPFTALVVQRLQSPGEYTSVGNDLLRIVDTTNIEASIKAPLSAVPYIQQGMLVSVKSPLLQKQQTIRTIVPVGNALSRTMEVRVALTPGDFAIGSAVRIALPHSDFHLAITVPRDALVLRKNGTYIYIVDENNIAQQIPVKTGIGVGDRIEVMAELSETDQVVVRGAERLRAGQKVRFQVATEIAKVS